MSESQKTNNFTVDGTPYSPISLSKLIENDVFKDSEDDKKKGSLKVLIPGTHEQLGFSADDPNTVNIMIKDRVEQAEFFIETVYPTLSRVPAYLYRYIHYMMFSEDSEFKYPRDNDYIMALSGGVLNQTDEEYVQIHNFIKWGKTNSECVHILGLVQLVGGTLKQAAKKGHGVRLFIEFPETGFHPKRERKVMSLLNKLKEDYGIKEDWTAT